MVDSNSVIGINGTNVDIHGVRLNVTYQHHIDAMTTLAFVTQRTDSNATGTHNVLEVKSKNFFLRFLDNFLFYKQTQDIMALLIQACVLG